MTRRLLLLTALALLAGCNQGLTPRPGTLQPAPAPARTDSSHATRP